MTKVSRLYPEQPVSQPVNDALHELDKAIAQAVDAAKAEAVPQGLIVALLHAYSHSETVRLVHGL